MKIRKRERVEKEGTTKERYQSQLFKGTGNALYVSIKGMKKGGKDRRKREEVGVKEKMEGGRKVECRKQEERERRN